YPQEMVITPTGRLYIGAQKTYPQQVDPTALLVEASPANGAVLGQGTFPKPAGSNGFGSSISTMAMSPEGFLWCRIDEFLTEIDPAQYQILRQANLNGAGYNGQTRQFRIDALGNVWTVSAYNPAGDMGGDLLCFSGSTAQLLATYKLGAGAIEGLA